MKEKEPCLSCKLITVGCMLSISGYLFYLAKKESPRTKLIYGSLATASAIFGVGEIFDKSPFRR